MWNIKNTGLAEVYYLSSTPDQTMGKISARVLITNVTTDSPAPNEVKTCSQQENHSKNYYRRLSDLFQKYLLTCEKSGSMEIIFKILMILFHLHFQKRVTIWTLF